MCPGNWLWASMTFMARFSRSSSRSPVRTRGILEEMPAVQHPFLNVFELERLLYTGKTACNHADEVWPGLYLGDQDIANNHRELRRLGITHVLNASHSRWRGTPESYEGLGIRYLGVEAHDSPAFDMSIHFQTVCHPGAGLPHAVPPPHPRGGHQESQGPPRHHPQPRLLEAAPGPGPQAAAGS
ncbi:dual specificity phosphatase 26 [Rhinolophus ferrumequinum]|uniref:Dual specificity protein phosphatase n=1 Tax=Rhinolophus ferrumequinum TaxID=59479 RepID=A0A7J7ZPY2_RHIFE|nr:dual specificity phosphatase 26 [Rhinolophus ferrumequinum]